MVPINVFKGRKNKVLVALSSDVSGDVITSEIRAEKDPESELLATWTVNFVTDGVDGELVLTLPSAATSDITKSTGWMDLKKVSAGEPFSVFNDPLEVAFKNVVTA